MHADMEVLVKARPPAVPGQTIEDIRAAWAVYTAALARPAPEDMTVFDRTIPTPERDVPVRIYHPAGHPAPRHPTPRPTHRS